MAISRSDIASYLANELHYLSAYIQLPETDTPQGFGYAIDQTVNLLGYMDEDGATLPIPSSKLIETRAVARYYGLKRLWTVLASMIDTSIGGAGSSRRDSQIFEHLTLLLKQARNEAAAYGYEVEPSSEDIIEIGFLMLDFLQPKPIN
jgi:hypothetical protein